MLKQKTLVVVVLVSAMALASVPMFAQAAAQSSPSAGAQPKAASDQDIQMLRRTFARSGKKSPRRT